MIPASVTELPPSWDPTWAKLSDRLISELPETAVSALKIAFRQGGSSSATTLFDALNSRGYFRQAVNVQTLIDVLTDWPLASVQALRAEFQQVQSAPPPAAVVNKVLGGQKRKVVDVQPAPAQQATIPGELVWPMPMPLLVVRGTPSEVKSAAIFEVNPAAKTALNQLSETAELVVVCAVGKYRGGKSFLLNRLMHQKSGFEVRSSSSGVTRGVWMWARWLSQRRIMLVLDTQGLFDPESDSTLSRNIFSLATLLSSVLLLNLESDIDESSLQQLAFVGEFADSICLGRGITGKQDQVASHSASRLYLGTFIRGVMCLCCLPWLCTVL